MSGERVLIVGDEGPGSLMQSYASAFRRCGATVSTYCTARAFAGATPSPILRVANRIVPGPLLARFNRRILSALANSRFDVVLVLKGAGIAPSTIQQLRRTTGAVLANFYPDDPFTDVRSNRLAFGVPTLRAYDWCFTFARHLQAQYLSEGVVNVAWLPFARDPDQHCPVTKPITAVHDVVFVGNLDAERIQWLEGSATQFKLAVFGEHTHAAVPRGSPLLRASFHPAAYGSGLCDALAMGKISLNVMRYQNRLSHNMRSYESLACGAFTLSQRTPELETMFRENEEVAFVNAPEQLPERLAYWLARADERARIAATGFARVRADTYDVRAKSILHTCLSGKSGELQ
jgi:hypothetical protein